MSIEYLSYHVPAFELPKEDHAKVSGIAMDVVEEVYQKVVRAPTPIPYVHGDLLAAVRTSELDLKKPVQREYWNYVVGLYPENAETNHRGLVLRVGKYDAQSPTMINSKDRPSWQIESRMGIKHLQLRGTDLNAVFSGVLINDPDLGVIVTPVSGLWAARKAKMGPAKGAPDAAVDLMNIVVTRAVLRALAKKTKATRQETVVESQWTRADTKETLPVRSIAVPGPINIHKMADDDVCLRYYGRKIANASVSEEPLCTKNIPTLAGNGNKPSEPTKGKAKGKAKR
jgi:hypothetical protein